MTGDHKGTTINHPGGGRGENRKKIDSKGLQEKPKALCLARSTEPLPDNDILITSLSVPMIPWA